MKEWALIWILAMVLGWLFGRLLGPLKEELIYRLDMRKLDKRFGGPPTDQMKPPPGFYQDQWYTNEPSR